MAKYDQYSVVKTAGTSAKPIVRTLSVLFEDGDTPSEVLNSADMLLLESGTGGDDSISETLQALSEQEMYDLMVEVWTAQMSTMGNGKYSYANVLRDAVNAAQNA